jgi:hypothetical protein
VCINTGGEKVFPEEVEDALKPVVVVDTIGRAANGKVDYKRLEGEAQERLGVS